MHIATVTSKKNRKLKTKMSQPFSSALLENAVNEFAKLPGIGRKTALRLVLHLLRQEEESVETFGNTIIQLRKEIKYCQICHNISDSDICALCNDATRDDSTICVVENIKEVMVVENTRQFRGRYHVLGGVISPMDGDTTNFYIFRKLVPYDIKISIIARGVSVGDELEYTDEVTLGRSIVNRLPFNETFKS